MPNKVIKSAGKRYGIYIVGAVVFIAAIIATLITFDVFTMEDTQEWFGLVIALVAAIYGLGQSILAAINTDKSTPPELDT